jgi:hypothetical protein
MYVSAEPASAPSTESAFTTVTTQIASSATIGQRRRDDPLPGRLRRLPTPEEPMTAHDTPVISRIRPTAEM